MLNYIKTIPLTLSKDQKHWHSLKTSSRQQQNTMTDKDSTGKHQKQIVETPEFTGEKITQLKDNTYAVGFASKESVRTSVHQTKNSLKPTLPFSYRNKQNSALGQIRTIGIKQRPNRIPKQQQQNGPQQAKQLPKQDIKNSPLQLLREDSKHNDSHIQLNSLMQRSYELKIVQLQDQNEKFSVIIAYLRAKLQTHQQEKQSMQLRINTIEKELGCLQLDYDQIVIQHHNVQIRQEKETQTENQTEQFHQKSNQTNDCFNSHNGSEPCEFCSIDSQDWFSRARYYQCLLQQQKVQSANKQKECKLQLQNGQIQWKLKVQMLQRQLNNLKQKYDGKCQEVREKQNLISKHILHKQ